MEAEEQEQQQHTMEDKSPSFECQNESDLYTTSGSSQGNKALTYPIGLISADEVAYAGGVYGISNNGYYLYTSQYYWTLSPFFYSSGAWVFPVFQDGSLTGNFVDYAEGGIRPVINLKANVKITSGNGTSSNPYVIG